MERIEAERAGPIVHIARSDESLPRDAVTGIVHGARSEGDAQDSLNRADRNAAILQELSRRGIPATAIIVNHRPEGSTVDVVLPAPNPPKL
ncbi:hypothetical protein HYS91_04035 [Candidatus Daviesbacteria bacterium]|nr:hypothetical protein [Candidatus Daviesbacteria bacterium]